MRKKVLLVYGVNAIKRLPLIVDLNSEKGLKVKHQKPLVENT